MWSCVLSRMICNICIISMLMLTPRLSPPLPQPLQYPTADLDYSQYYDYSEGATETISTDEYTGPQVNEKTLSWFSLQQDCVLTFTCACKYSVCAPVLLVCVLRACLPMPSPVCCFIVDVWHSVRNKSNFCIFILETALMGCVSS